MTLLSLLFQQTINRCHHFRQFKEQQRLSRQTEERPSHVSYRGEQKMSDPGPPGSRTSFSNLSSQSNKLSQKTSLDIKSVQKEAVMSYLDRMREGGPPAPPAPGAAGAPPDIAPPPPPAASSVSPRHAPSYHTNHHSNNANQKTTSIPTVNRGLPTSTSRTR